MEIVEMKDNDKIDFCYEWNNKLKINLKTNLLYLSFYCADHLFDLKFKVKRVIRWYILPQTSAPHPITK